VKGILKLGYKLLVNDKAKFSALILGITFAVYLMIVCDFDVLRCVESRLRQHP
jgi:hypothetical protein